MDNGNTANEVNGSSRENASGQRSRPRWWSDESLTERVWGGDRSMRVIGNVAEAVWWLIGFVVVLIRVVGWLNYGLLDSFGDLSELALVRSAGLIPGFKGFVRRVLIVALALPLILVGWLVRWARRRCS